jgi:hypothetical protein
MQTIQQGKAPGVVASATTAGRWFKRVVWIGIVTNLALAIPTISVPATMLALAGFPPAPDLWPRFAGLLLTLVSLAYVPAAIDPDRHRISAWFTLVSRLAGVLFFSIQPTYRLLGLLDLVFLIPQAVLLILAVRTERG